MNINQAALALLLATGTVGCALDPVHVEADFGNSVRQMVAAQIYDPVAASNPDPLPPLLVDGQATTEALGGYRTDARREERREYRGLILAPDEGN